jgi:hypothetical protein
VRGDLGLALPPEEIRQVSSAVAHSPSTNQQDSRVGSGEPTKLLLPDKWGQAGDAFCRGPCVADAVAERVAARGRKGSSVSGTGPRLHGLGGFLSDGAQTVKALARQPPALTGRHLGRQRAVVPPAAADGCAR